jgi:hypothetical protein
MVHIHHRCARLSLVAIFLAVACMHPVDGAEPDAPDVPVPKEATDMTPEDLMRAYVEQQGGDPTEIARREGNDFGAFQCFFGGVPGHTFVSSTAVLGRDGGGDWSRFVGAAEPAAVALAYAVMMSDQAPRHLTPSSKKPGRVSEQDWALITEPTLWENGGQTFRAWYGNPPDFAPWRLEISVPADGSNATITQSPSWKLLKEVAQTDKYLDMLTNAGDKQAQRNAAAWLGDQHEARAEPGLLALLDSDWVDARQAAAKALGQLAATAAVPGIKKIVMTETNPYALSDEIAALAAIGGEEARAALQVVAKDHPIEDARDRATNEIGRMK